MAKVTDEQLKTLRDKLDTLVTDKGIADAATQTSNTANTAAATAMAAAHQAQLDESAADAQSSAALADLVAFVDGLAGPVTPPA